MLLGKIGGWIDVDEPVVSNKRQLKGSWDNAAHLHCHQFANFVLILCFKAFDKFIDRITAGIYWNDSQNLK